MKDKGRPGKRRETVYRRPGSADEKWSGPIERLSWGGLGVARGADGRLLLLSAPLALFPGEEVEASVRWKVRHGEGRVLRWTRFDPRRVPARCPVAEACGGCDLWGAGECTGELKQAMAADLLARQLPEIRDWRWIPAPEDALRHRIQLHWDGRMLGFFRRQSHAVVPVKACPAAVEPLSSAIPRLEEALASRILPQRAQRWELSTGTPAATVFATSESGRSWRLDPDGWRAAEEPVVHAQGRLRLAHRPGGFFQVSAPWAMEAFGNILKAWDLRGGTLYDLYGGVGLFSALLGSRFRDRVLVESDGPAVAQAGENLRGMGLSGECIEADAAEWLPEGLGAPEDLLLLDPPRAGLVPELCAKLQTSGAGTLVLVGCDGAAFCRDAKRLAPRWRLAELAVLDLFPLTHHAEFVGLFRGEPIHTDLLSKR